MTTIDKHIISDAKESAVESINSAMTEFLSVRGYQQSNPSILFDGSRYYYGSSLSGIKRGHRVLWDIEKYGWQNYEPVWEDYLINKDTYIYDLATIAAKTMLKEWGEGIRV